jgi:hypothetical protein
VEPAAPEPEVPAATWALVEQDVLLASVAARSDAVAYARPAVEQWMGRVRRYTEETFIPWYTSYWTQEWLAVKVAFSRSDDPDGDAVAVRKLAGYLQEKYIAQVLEPASEEIDPSGILLQATRMYVGALAEKIEAIGERYQLPEKAYQRRLDQIPAISVGDTVVQLASLVALIQSRDLNGLAPYAALMEQIESQGVYVNSRLSEGRLSPIASAVAETFVRKIVARGGAAAAAAVVGGPAGFAISLGITGLGVAEHNKQKPELEAQLREILGPAMEQMQRNLLDDPRYGVLGAVNHINSQIEQALRAAPTETELRPYEYPLYEAPLNHNPSYQDPW